MLVVFDLDFTLWDAGGTWCDHTFPPYKRVNGHILDGDQRVIYLYPDVVEILQFLQSKGIKMALASRTHSPETAEKLLRLFDIDHHFAYRQIYPGSKTVHFRRLQKESGFSYDNMFFFDDEYRNIEEVGSLGVQAQFVQDGLTWNDIHDFPAIAGT